MQVIYFSMTAPAFLLRVDQGNCFLVTPDAICLYDLCSMLRQPDPFGDTSGIEEDNIFHAVNGFPDVMDRQILIGEMAVSTLSPTVRP
jgi:hypothetical protein